MVKNENGWLSYMSINEIIEILSYPFMARAIIVGILISLCASLLGVILVLKNYSLIGHGLSDVGFASISIAVACGFSPIYLSTPIVILASFVIMYISQSKKINGDIAIGIFSTGSLALGVIVTAISNGLNMDVYAYMFGSILSMNNTDVFMSIILSAVVLTLFILFYNRLFIVTIDESFAKSIGINIQFYQFLISLLTALTVVIGIRMMGTLLISSLIIFSAFIAKKFVRSFKSLMFLSATISILCFLIGVLVSLLLNIPTGASIVIVNIIVLIISFIISKISDSISLCKN